MNIKEVYKKLYPLTIVMDRYTGVYSGGEFTAWNLDPDEVPEEICWDDGSAMDFFDNIRKGKSTFVYGVGATPDEAAKDLYMKMRGRIMPIINENGSTYVNYEIPQEIDSRIPDYFYYAMAGELVSIFGAWILEKQDYPEYDGGNEIYCDLNVDGSYYDLASSTGGWYEAFKMTCKKLDMMWLIDYYKTLEYYDSDIFDGIIESRIIENYIEKDHTHDSANCYYKYLCQIK